ncbi:MAG: biotin/lipoyl-binding protein [Verrucomicrobiaceae bacterium]|nr:MAG: biotin/lipoyl-binding protein [Verrucomicrobiaceae bacterium]
MIKAIRHQSNADKFQNDIRKHGKRYGRYVYIAFVLGFGVYLVDMFVGPYVWLEADGLVNADRVTVAATHEEQVVKINVKSGQYVKKGDVLAVVHSPQVASALATLANQYADTQAKQSDLNVRVDVSDAVTKAAEDRLAEAENNMKRLNAQRGSGFISDTFIGGALRERYLAVSEKSRTEAEKRSAAQQLKTLTKAQQEAREAIDDIKRRYNNGLIVAPDNGFVGAQVAQQGDVLKPGEYITDMFVGQKHVLAYLPTGTLYTVKKGERVTVADGFNRAEGTLVDIRPISVQLPPAFQKAFRPQERGQVATVMLDNPEAFTHSTKVRVIGHNLIPGYDGITSETVKQAVRDWSVFAWTTTKTQIERLAVWVNGETKRIVQIARS